MAMIDPFTPDAFRLHTLTAAINNVPYQPTRIAQLGWFQEAGVSTLSADIEERDGQLSLLGIHARGANGTIQLINDNRKLHTFRIPHIPQRAAIMADEVTGVRAFGTESTTEVLQSRITERLTNMRRDIDYTIESHRLSAIMGNFYDANGVATSLFTTFGVTQQSLSFALGTSTTKIRSKCQQAIELVEDQLKGIPFTGLRALCGKNFWDGLVTHPMVEQTVLNYNMAQSLRADPRLEVSFGGIMWERYRGTSAVKVPDNEAYLVPDGVPGLFLTRFAPADYIETVNTIGIPYYVKSEAMKYGKGMEMEAQSNPLNLCTRPSAIIKLTVV